MENDQQRTTVVQGSRLDGSRDRPAREPGGMECIKCGCIFIGEEWHSCCAVCVRAKSGFETTHGGAVEIAAKATGLRPDQIVAAVEEYRKAVVKIDVEPIWRAIIHMCGSREACHQYVADGTKIVMQIESWKERGQWRQEKCYVIDGEGFQHFAEARQAELAAQARPAPREVRV